MFRKYIYTALLALFSLTVYGQVVLLPSARSFNDDIRIMDMTIDLGDRPIQFADRLDTNIALKKDSIVTFISKGAKNMGCYLKGIDQDLVDSVIVEGKFARRAYRREDIVNQGLLPLPVGGEEISLRYYGKQSQIDVEYVASGFIKIADANSPFNTNSNSNGQDTQYRSSGRCEVNAICDKDISETKKSICRLIIGGLHLGTGQLINTTSEDKQPYIITAAHVFNGNENYAVNVLFGFETDLCTNFEHPLKEKVDLCYKEDLLCYLPSYDIAVFTLNKLPKAEVNPYWAGWDIRDNIVSNETYKCIHHPYGDVKKVSVTTDIGYGDYSGMDTPPAGGSFEKNVHYRVYRWDQGTTEGGSSGSAFWNKEHKIIGLLSGGKADCKTPQNDYFTSLAKAWDVKASGYNSLRELLDPDNTGALFMTGRYMNTTESSVETVVGDDGYDVARHCGSVTLIADSITDVKVYSSDGRMLYNLKTEGRNTVDVNTSKWTNKLLIFVIRYGNKKESSIKLIAK